MVIPITGNGASASITLATGVHALSIEAVVWDGASVVLQEAVDGAFFDSDDPYNTGNALTRTANGKVIVANGGIKYRLNVSSFGASTAGLRLLDGRSER